ncbi:DUF3152 domain-containing protein [Sanguibacter inulinus]|uniref:DUF3152 domain-containing protein n=1 Tax=Sanguibacter inulinus TaxID=60922 RepID=A0A853EP90_9MICO|nr:DUF3152 domain-containing protein [Sanguibacter inulinus]MBF0721195.1 DUF3152 domain-containing protein [Sanguibacter inulinus]NYS92340.1 DUF3152 domain-containing protein [Sanguibacter inulinus]
MPTPRPLPDARDASRSPQSGDSSGLTRSQLRAERSSGQIRTSTRVSRRSGMRVRPAVAVVLAGVLAGTGAGAVWSALDNQQPDASISPAGTATGAQPRADDRASRDDERDVLAEPTPEAAAGEGSGVSATAVSGSGSDSAAGSGSVLSLNPLDIEALPDIAAARPQAGDSAASGSGDVAGLAADDPAQVAELGASEAVAPVLPEGVDEVDFAAGILSADVPESGTGVLDVVPGSSPAPGAGEVSTVRIQVEQGLDVDGTKVADLVLTTLNDPRSWGGDGSRTFARTDAADATFTVTLASPSTVDRLCAPLDTGGLWSCGVTDHAVLNYLRWVEGSPNYGEDMAAYRQYLINHEVGHVLGHRHEQCGATDSLAPVMVQQSGTTIRCVPNGWPRP